jgi:hypothetical protein
MSSTFWHEAITLPTLRCRTQRSRAAEWQRKRHMASQSLELGRDAANMATRYLDHSEISREMPHRMPAVLRRKIYDWHGERCGNIPSESFRIHFFEVVVFRSRN